MWGRDKNLEVSKLSSQDIAGDSISYGGDHHMVKFKGEWEKMYLIYGIHYFIFLLHIYTHLSLYISVFFSTVVTATARFALADNSNESCPY